MLEITEIIHTSTFSQNKLYVPKRVREILGLNDQEKIIWGLTRKGEIIVKKSTDVASLF